MCTRALGQPCMGCILLILLKASTGSTEADMGREGWYRRGHNMSGNWTGAVNSLRLGITPPTPVGTVPPSQLESHPHTCIHHALAPAPTYLHACTHPILSPTNTSSYSHKTPAFSYPHALTPSHHLHLTPTDTFPLSHLPTPFTSTPSHLPTHHSPVTQSCQHDNH